MSEAFQFRANEVAKIILVHKKLTLVKQIKDQDSLVFELIYLLKDHPDSTILKLFMAHHTFEEAVRKEAKTNTLLERCKQFNITAMHEYLLNMITSNKLNESITPEESSTLVEPIQQSNSLISA